MQNNHPKLLKSYFDCAHNKSILKNIQHKAITLNKINTAIKQFLPIQVHPWCRVANLRQGVLILETANSCWLMFLIYQKNRLLSDMRNQLLPSLKSIDIKINPSLAATKEQKTKQKNTYFVTENTSLIKLSKLSAENLRKIANLSPQKLKKTLERLASLA